MATFFVDGTNGNDNADGSAATPWKSLGKAATTVASGDEVRIRTATYRESLRIGVSNTKWIADTGHKPILDGRYHEGLLSNSGTMPDPWQPGSNYLPAHPHDALITLAATGVVVDGLSVRNVAGNGIAVTGDSCVVRNCRVDFCYRHCLSVETTDTSYVNNAVLENNVATRASVAYFDPVQGNRTPESCACIAVGRSRDAGIRNNIVAYNYGAGIAAARGPIRTVIEGNVVHTCKRGQILNERAVDTTIRNNLIFHLALPAFLRGNTTVVPAGIVLADEEPGDTRYARSTAGQIYNNIVVGTGALFVVHNGNNADTQLNQTYIGYNTFVGGARTHTGIQITGNARGRPHRDSLFENNLVLCGTKITAVTGDISGVAFRNNLWSIQPANDARGPGDRIGEAYLADPSSNITGNALPDPGTNIDPRNYMLTERSTLAVGMASDESRLNNIQPPSVHKDFFGANRDEHADIGAHEYLGTQPDLTANFSIGPGQESGPAPHTVDFVDKSTSNRPIVSWAWQFGDGEVSTERNPSHTYLQPGRYDVTLKVVDDRGNEDTATLDSQVEVQELVPVIPPDFRRFAVVSNGPGIGLAFGTQYPDGRCILVWHQEPRFVLDYSDLDDVIRHEVFDGRRLLWIDEASGDVDGEALVGGELGAVGPVNAG